MTIQNHCLTAKTISEITEAPARVVPRNINFDQVVIVLDGSKKAERILPHALRFTREQNAELVIVHTCKSDVVASAQDDKELYIKSIKNKMMAQHEKVAVFLYDGTKPLSALQSVINNQMQTCVMVMDEKRNFWSRMLHGNMFAEFAKYENVLVQEVIV